MHVLERDGRGPAVLCVHGYCQSSEYWKPTIERLAEAGVQTLAPDLPGFGASAGEPGPYTIFKPLRPRQWKLRGRTRNRGRSIGSAWSAFRP